jgi:hypothetical protein
MMTLLHDHAVLAVDAIKDPDQRAYVIKELTDIETNKYPYEIIKISH